jgi:23S rRNA (cytosine1962-C5)-methyltransferase
MGEWDVVLARAAERVAAAAVCNPVGDPVTGAFRLFHGRGCGLPQFSRLTVDWYARHLLVTVHGDLEGDLGALLRMLAATVPALSVTLQQRSGRDTRTTVVSGDLPAEHWVSEGGLKYWVRLGRNQNVGLFLDMQPLRSWLRANSAGARILNLFAFTCSLSVAALAGGARVVVNNDMNRNALAWGRRNHQLNGHDDAAVKMLPHELLRSWAALRRLGRFDGVVIDPPTNQRGSFNAERQYGKVLARLPELLAPGAWIQACLNSPFLDRDFLPQQMALYCPEARFQSLLAPSADFADCTPERGLKVARFIYRPQ